ncbi:MAG: cytochrome c peroxidase [Caldilineaceae bacterium]
MLYSLRYLADDSPINAQAIATFAAENSQATNATADGAGTSPGGLSPEVVAALSTVFGPLPDSAPPSAYEMTPALVDLGRTLFYDPRLSISQTMSCNDCHPLDNYGVDNFVRSIGVNGKPVERNTPTVYNAALHVSQFWDGRSPDVEDQATRPVVTASEMGMLDDEMVHNTLNAIPVYAKMFEAAFPNDSNPMTLKNVGIAIGAFERGLLTPSRFDLYLKGDFTQLTEQEQRGMAKFIELRCATCHVGATLGGLSYKRLGEYEPYETEDVGRYNVTGQDEDKYVFKVPSLRNVAKTAPYFHDGSVETLDQAVRIMVRHQLGKTVTDEEVADVVAFLNALTGELPTDYIAQPVLPN